MELNHNATSYVSTDKDNIEKALIVEYDAKYRLANSSPFLKEPLLSALGPMALNANAEKIMNGSFVCPPGVKKHTRRFIQHLAKDECILDKPPNKLGYLKVNLMSFGNE